MTAVVADTHAFVWYIFEPGRLSHRASETFDQCAGAGDPIYISAISLVEVIYLADKGRIPDAVLERLKQELEKPEAEVRVVPLTAQIASTVREVAREIVPDMPDRIIAATALFLEIPLVTRDHRIRAGTINTIW